MVDLKNPHHYSMHKFLLIQFYNRLSLHKIYNLSLNYIRQIQCKYPLLYQHLLRCNHRTYIHYYKQYLDRYIGRSILFYFFINCSTYTIFNIVEAAWRTTCYPDIWSILKKQIMKSKIYTKIMSRNRTLAVGGNV